MPMPWNVTPRIFIDLGAGYDAWKVFRIIGQILLLVLFMEVSFLAISGEEAFRNTDH